MLEVIMAWIGFITAVLRSCASGSGMRGFSSWVSEVIRKRVQIRLCFNKLCSKSRCGHLESIIGVRSWLRNGMAYFLSALVIQRCMVRGKNDRQRPYCWIH